MSVEPGFLVWTCVCPRSTHASSHQSRELAEATVLSDPSMQGTTGLPLCNRDASRPPGTIDIRCTMRPNRPLQMATCCQVQRVAEEKNRQAADCPARTAGVLSSEDGRRVYTHLHRIRCPLLGSSCMMCSLKVILVGMLRRQADHEVVPTHFGGASVRSVDSQHSYASITASPFATIAFTATVSHSAGPSSWYSGTLWCRDGLRLICREGHANDDCRCIAAAHRSCIRAAASTRTQSAPHAQAPNAQDSCLYLVSCLCHALFQRPSRCIRWCA